MNAPRSDKGARWEELASRWAKHTADMKPAITARDAMAQGTALLMLKEATVPGGWRNEVNKRGLSASTASRLIACARRFDGAGPGFFDAAATAAKLYELLPLDKGAVTDLEEGKSWHGLTLEGMRAASVLELRTAVRAALLHGDACTPETPSAPPPAVTLTVSEERMLRLFRKCAPQARAALFAVAEALTLR